MLISLVNSHIHMMSQGDHTVEDRPALSPASQMKAPGFLALPTELRQEIYRAILVTRKGNVEVVSNYLDGQQKPEKMTFYTTRDLSLLEVNRQVRAEASELFYAENTFTLRSYPRTQEYGQRPLYGMKSHLIDYSRVRKAHVLTLRGSFPNNDDHCIKGAHRMRAFLEGISEALTGGHCMRYMLIQSYEFEIFRLREGIGPCQLVEILKPLEKVRGLQSCHIRAMRMNLWPYLRFLEREVTRTFGDQPDPGSSRQSRVEKASDGERTVARNGAVEVFGNPDLDPPQGRNIFDLLQAEQLYVGVDFLDLFHGHFL